MTTTRSFDCWSYRCPVSLFCLGGNDVYGSLEPVLTVDMHLYEYAQSLIARGVSHVVVCQTVRRQYSWKEGTQLVLDVNEFMKAVCDTECLSFWSHRGVRQKHFPGRWSSFEWSRKLQTLVKGAVFVPESPGSPCTDDRPIFNWSGETACYCCSDVTLPAFKSAEIASRDCLKT